MPTETHAPPERHRLRRGQQQDLERRLERHRRELQRLDEAGNLSQWTARYWRARTLLNEMRQAAHSGWHQLYDTVDELTLELERSIRELSEAAQERFATTPNEPK